MMTSETRFSNPSLLDTTDSVSQNPQTSPSRLQVFKPSSYVTIQVQSDDRSRYVSPLRRLPAGTEKIPFWGNKTPTARTS
jgi:hypothetical protein